MRTHADYTYDDLKYHLVYMSDTERKELFELIAKEYNMETGEKIEQIERAEKGNKSA